MSTALTTPGMLPPELQLYNPAQEIAAGAVWLRGILEASGQKRYVLGLSGGLDSATVALWVGRAGLTNRLTLLALPYEGAPGALLDPSSPESLEDARLIAEMLPEAEFRVVNIRPMVDVVLKGLGYADNLRAGRADTDLRMAAANAKALVRAVLLRTEARRARGLLLGTENRTENLLGYFTIGGDEQSDLELLGQFLKTHVRQLAEALGVPERILAKAPTADLWAGQTDESELGFRYEEADYVLYYSGDHLNIAETLNLMRVGARAVPGRISPPPWAEDVARRVIAQRYSTHFKRAAKPVFMPTNRTHA